MAIFSKRSINSLAGDRAETAEHTDELLFALQSGVAVGGQLLSRTDDVRLNLKMRRQDHAAHLPTQLLTDGDLVVLERVRLFEVHILTESNAGLFALK